MMASRIPELQILGRKLIAVPAVHYRAVFANHVHTVCKKETTRPDAIAVELGSCAVAEISKWFLELEIGKCGAKLPTMLGLVRRNRRIHPKFKERAVRLQAIFGRPIHELPPSVLKESLGYAAFSLVCLSSTDSIIEAIRCAMEMDIPVYGIDMEESAHAEGRHAVIEDPQRAFEDLSGYVARNYRRPPEERDDYISDRREEVMAARLKFLLSRYKRILFTGGLAHWSNIQRLLADPRLEPATQLFSDEEEEYTRVLVHPAYAVNQMDMLPGITGWYEKKRGQVHLSADRNFSTEFTRIFRSQIDAAYRIYFIEPDKERICVEKQKDREKLSAFEHFLDSICMVAGHRLPHFMATLDAAGAILSPEFVAVLSETLLRKDLEWALPKDFPNLPLIGPPPAGDDGTSLQDNRSACFWMPRGKRGEDDEVIYDRSSPFSMSDVFETGSPPIQVEAPWFVSEPASVSRKNRRISELPWIWPPCEFLLHGTAHEAANISKSNASIRKSEAFEGMLLDGIDMKATLRAKIRGDKTLYVHNKQKDLMEDTAIAQGKSLEPTVFIFETPAIVKKYKWELGLAGEFDMRDHIRPSEIGRFDEAVRKFGPAFVGSVSYSDIVLSFDSRTSFGTRARQLMGYTTFGNPCANVKQSVLWLEATRYKGCPILRGSGVDELVAFYRKQYNISLNPVEMSSTLIRLAIPYARNRVVIIAPDGFTVDQVSRQEAGRRRIGLDVVSASVFPQERIRKIRRRYSVYAGKGGMHIQRELEQQLGHPDSYLDMLPPMMQLQVLSNR